MKSLKLYKILRAILDFLKEIGVLEQKVPFDPKDMKPAEPKEEVF